MLLKNVEDGIRTVARHLHLRGKRHIIAMLFGQVKFFNIKAQTVHGYKCKHFFVILPYEQLFLTTIQTPRPAQPHADSDARRS